MNRFDGGRFSEKRAVFNSVEIGDVLEEVKQDHDWTWSEFAEYFDVSMYTIRHDWRKKADSIPISVAEKLKELSRNNLEVLIVDAFQGQSKGGSKSYSQGSIPDNWSVKLAELYGALLGDGCIYSNMNSFCITGNAKLDEKYIYYLQSICISIFDVKPKVRFQESENVIRLTLNSRKITRFLKESGFKTGEKSDQKFELPEELYTEEKLKAVLRGLFDTDGGIYHHPNTDIMLDITAKNESIHALIVEISEGLEVSLGVTSDRVQLYGEEKIDMFLDEVGSSNSRNIKRYLYYKENMRVPEAHSETLLKSRSYDFDMPFYGFMV